MDDKILELLKNNLREISSFIKFLQDAYQDLTNLLAKFSQILSKFESLFK